MTASYRTSLRNARLDAVRDDIGNSGLLRFYNGTPPASINAALSGNTLLAECTGNSTLAPAASGGTQTYNAITADSSADASGTCTFARWYRSDGTTAVEQLTVGTSGADINFNSVAFAAAAQVSISSYAKTAGNP